MGKIDKKNNKVTKKDNKKNRPNTKKNSSKKKEVLTNGKDPASVRVVFALFMLFMILTFVVGAFSIVVVSSANENDGIMTFGSNHYATVSEYSTGFAKNYMVAIDGSAALTSGKKVAFKNISNGRLVINEGIFKEVKDNRVVISIDTTVSGTPEKKDITILKNRVVGTIMYDITSPFVIGLATTNYVYLIIFAAFVAFTIVLGLVYYLISPRGAKQLELKKEETVVKTVTTVNGDNSELLTHYLSTDDNIQPIEIGENKTGELLNINYYNSVRLHSGEVYCVVKKYHETVRRLEEYGASDMDIIKMNMIGNNEFDELILNTHKEKSMSLWEIIDFARQLDGVYCIKKRGTLNWTYKYKSKTLFILKREDNESESYKVAIKVYPDAATKLNIIYKALEDSSFPIGPYWYMFNDLRNLPANVIKWLIVESLNISKWQQTKADLLRESPTLEDYKLDKAYMHDMIVAGTRKLDMGKFTIITQDDTFDNVKFDTVLETGFSEMDMNPFTKEIAMVVPGLKNTQMSILTRKNASEALVTALCNELSEFDNAKDPTPEQQAAEMNKIATPQVSTKVVKKSKKK